MLSPYRRLFAVLSFLLLATPLVVGFVRPDDPASIRKEGRRLAPTPTAPDSWEGLRALPKEVDAYLQDHFGLRERMIRTHRDLSHPVLLGNESVLIGRNGRMFYLGNEMVRQSAGLVMRDQQVADAADMLAAMREALSRRGIRFLVAVPPNASTIYQDDLPLWAQNHGTRTEYDLFLDDLAARGVKAVDLRPVVKSVQSERKAYFMNDTHWTAPAAVAGFNAIVEADGRPDWHIDPATALGSPSIRKGGDVARILGVENEVAESADELALPSAGKTENLSDGAMPDHVDTSDKPGLTVMVIGDSFTAYNFPPMLLQHVKRAVWLNHHLCGFDWKRIDEFHPDEVWWIPTERFLVCNIGAHPINFTGVSEQDVARP
jgi:hypothetical protein